MKERNEEKITYNSFFWIFVIGCILGVIIEGLYCQIKKGAWETHVVSVWGWFNLLYGVGAVLFYGGAIALKKVPFVFRVIILTIAATVLELICGLYLKNVLGMKAWNYSHRNYNLFAVVCLDFSFAWAIIAFVFCIFANQIRSGLQFFEKTIFKKLSLVLTIVLAMNFIMAFMAITRWSERHYGVAHTNIIGSTIDKLMPDEWMEHRFVEWRFLS